MQVGQILAIGEGPATPEGLLAQVTAVTTSGDQTIVSTVPAALTQAVQSGSFDEQVSSPTVSTAARRQDSTVLAHAAQAAVTCQGSADASVTASLSVGASVDATGSWSYFSLKTASVTGEAHASASIDAELNAAGSCTLAKTVLVTLPGPKAAFSIGPIPVVLTSEIPVYLDAGAQIGATVSTSIGGGFDAQAGIGWTKAAGFYPIDNFTPSFSFNPPNLSANASVDANLTPTLEVTVDGFGHANLALKAGLALNANTSATPWWTLTAPVSLTADLDLSIPHVVTLTSPTLNIYQHTFTLATSGGPFGGSGGSRGEGGTTTPSPGTLSIVAGNGESGPPTPGPATQSELGQPTDVAVDSHGNLYVTDLKSDVVEEVTSSGQLSIFAGQVGQSGTPTPGAATGSDFDLSDGGTCGGIAVNRAGDVYVADCGNDVVEEVTPSGQLSIVAGQVGQAGTPTPGPATSSDLDDPAGVAVDGSGNLYIADNGNDVVEKVTPAGQLSIIAGEVGQDGPPTPGPATSSEIGSVDIAADAVGDVYIADAGSDVVEKVTPAGQLSIIAGEVGQDGPPTPGPATGSDLDFGGCGQVAVDGVGDVYVADCGNDVVEEVTPSGQLSIVAGQAGQYGLPTPGPATSSYLDAPTGIAVDGSGNVYVADSGNALVDEVTPADGSG
jgi:hypothetical protein